MFFQLLFTKIVFLYGSSATSNKKKKLLKTHCSDNRVYLPKQEIQGENYFGKE